MLKNISGRKPKIYIAGPVSALPYDEAVKRFRNAEAVLQIDFKVVNPTKLCRAHWGWYRCMAVCLFNLLKCNVVFMLPDWEVSRGARIEHRGAIWLGKSIIYSGK